MMQPVVIAPSADPEATVVSAPAPVDPMVALRAQIEAEVRAKIATEEATRVDPGWIKPGVRSPFQEAISQTRVQTGDVPLNGTQAPPAHQVTLSDGTVRQDF